MSDAPTKKAKVCKPKLLQGDRLQKSKEKRNHQTREFRPCKYRMDETGEKEMRKSINSKPRKRKSVAKCKERKKGKDTNVGK